MLLAHLRLQKTPGKECSVLHLGHVFIAIIITWCPLRESNSHVKITNLANYHYIKGAFKTLLYYLS